MGVIVQFDYQTWVKTFPEMEGISAPQAQLYFDIATGIHRNDGGGPIGDPGLQSRLLNVLTSHVAYLFAMRDQSNRPNSTGTNPPPGVVGRITSASEGSVSVSTEAIPNLSSAMALLAQTSYGALYLSMTAQFRTARYRPYFDVRRATH